MAFRLRPESENEALGVPCWPWRWGSRFEVYGMYGLGVWRVGFRVPVEVRARTLQALHLDFLPPGPQMSSYVPLRIAAVLGAIVGFSALSVCSWIYTVPWSPTVATAHSLFSCLKPCKP